MSMLNPLKPFANLNKGERVDRAAAVFSTSVTAAVTTPLFTIAGGRVVIREIIGQITVAASDFMSLSLQSNPTTGTTAAMCTGLELFSLEAGTILGITGAVGDAMYGVSAAVTQTQLRDLILPIGAIEAVLTSSSPTTTTSAPVLTETVTIK